MRTLCCYVYAMKINVRVIAGAATLGILLAGCTGGETPYVTESTSQTPDATTTPADPTPTQSAPEEAAEPAEFTVPELWDGELTRASIGEVTNPVGASEGKSVKGVFYNAVVRCVSPASGGTSTVSYEVKVNGKFNSGSSAQCDGQSRILDLGEFAGKKVRVEIEATADPEIDAYVIVVPFEQRDSLVAFGEPTGL